jgi:hypothetical protein
VEGLMPAPPLTTALGMSQDQLNSMFANPQFQQNMGGMFASPIFQQGMSNWYANPQLHPLMASLFQSGQNLPSAPQGMTGGAPAAGSPYASMYQPPSMINLDVDPNNPRQTQLSYSAPQAPNTNFTPYDPRSYAQMNTAPQTMQSIQAAQAAMQPKQKSPSFWDQALQIAGPLIGIGLSSI